MHTEAEAREKWCPFARLATVQRPAPFNRAAPVDIDADPMMSKAVCCIASDCMAWRWVIALKRIDDPRGIAFDPTYEDVQTDKGYCGLASKP